jgi:hypothetical protein
VWGKHGKKLKLQKTYAKNPYLLGSSIGSTSSLTKSETEIIDAEKGKK